MHSICRCLHGMRFHCLFILLFSQDHTRALVDSEARHIPSYLPLPTSRRHYFIRTANATHVWNHLHWLPPWQHGCHFPHSKADLPSPFRQMHMPTATLPSSGEESNPLLKKKRLIQILASISFFQWIKKKKKMTWQIISGLFAQTWLSVSDRITWWMVVIRQIGQQSRGIE